MYMDEKVPELDADQISKKWNENYREGSHPLLGALSCAGWLINFTIGLTEHKDTVTVTRRNFFWGGGATKLFIIKMHSGQKRESVSVESRDTY